MKVEVVEIHGDEDFIKKISGISHGSEGASVEKLLNWGHLSPLEFAGVTFKVTCPIFVARQMMRHRTGKYMEASLRYCESGLEFYTPPELEDDLMYKFMIENSKFVYSTLLEKYGKGRGNELARCVLPVSTVTEFYMQMDMRNLTHFLLLRLADGAQIETRLLASDMLDLIEEKFPTITAYIIKEVFHV